MSSVAVDSETLPINKLTLLDQIQIFLALLPARECPSVSSFERQRYMFNLAVVLVWSLLKAPFTPYGRAKSWKRIIADRVLLMMTTGMNRRQIRAVFGPTRAIYENFLREAKLTPLVEEIGGDARLLWIGRKITDNVVLYFHGV